MKYQKARKIKQNNKTPDDLDRSPTSCQDNHEKQQMPDDLDGCPTRVVGRTPAMFHNTLVVGSSIRKPGKSSKTVKTPGDLDRCPTKGAGRTPTMFHNTLVVGSSP